MDYIENNQLTKINYLVNNPFFWIVSQIIKIIKLFGDK